MTDQQLGNEAMNYQQKLWSWDVASGVVQAVILGQDYKHVILPLMSSMWVLRYLIHLHRKLSQH